MENTKENKMGTEPIFKLIMSMSIPAMFSMLIQALYNIVDSYFVAKIGEEALTSVSLAFPLQMLIVSVAVGTGVGINSLISRKLGQKNQQAADKAATHGIILAVFSWLIFAAVGILFSRTFFEKFTTNQNIINMGSIYTFVALTFSLGVFIQINIEKTLQATGDMIHPMICQLMGAVTNIILDPIMIFGLFGFPKLGVLGAAVATVIGQCVAAVYMIYIIYAKEHMVNITFKNFKFDWKTIKDIYIVGVPSIIMQSIGSVMATTLNAILIGFSEAAVSVFGVYFKLQSFVFMPVFGLTQGVMPIMGYNYGAKNRKRLVSTIKVGSVVALIIMTVGTLIFMVFPRQLLMIFNASDKMLEIGILALRVISLSFISAAIGIMFSTLFQAIGKGVNSLIISVLRQLVLIIPLAFLLAKTGVVGNVWFAFPLSECAALVVSIIMYISIYKKQIKNL